jgi:hypothetical protein
MKTGIIPHSKVAEFEEKFLQIAEKVLGHMVLCCLGN